VNKDNIFSGFYFGGSRITRNHIKPGHVRIFTIDYFDPACLFESLMVISQ